MHVCASNLIVQDGSNSKESDDCIWLRLNGDQLEISCKMKVSALDFQESLQSAANAMMHSRGVFVNVTWGSEQDRSTCHMTVLLQHSSVQKIQLLRDLALTDAAVSGQRVRLQVPADAALRVLALSCNPDGVPLESVPDNTLMQLLQVRFCCLQSVWCRVATLHLVVCTSVLVSVAMDIELS